MFGYCEAYCERRTNIMELSGKKVNFLGDSITEGVGASCVENIYLNVLKRKENLAAARNYGWSGSRIARQLDFRGEDPEYAYVDRFYKMDDDADIIVVFGGTNDYGHGDAPLGTMEDRTPTTFYGACHLLIEGLMNKYPLATIVFMTPIHRDMGPDIDRIHPSRYNATLLDYSNIIKEVAQYYSVPVVDLFATAGIHPEIKINKEKLCPDGLHPNDAGNEIIASRLAGVLKAL